MTFLSPWKNASDSGFQITQSFLAFGSGGPFGVGLGEGKQKLFFLPEAHTDFVLALVGEELGLVGSVAIVLLFGLFVLKGFQIAGRARDPFGRHLAMGITMLVGMQALVNAGVVTGLLPTKGLTLPFVSYGGSSLVANLFGVGILLSISRDRQGGRESGGPRGARKRGGLDGMTIVIAAGGTGGHLYPAIAVAREFLQRDPSTRILFVGTTRGIERKVLAHEGFSLQCITANPLMGKRPSEMLKACSHCR